MDCEKTDDKLEMAFDAGEDMEEFFDFESPAYPNRAAKSIEEFYDVS